MLGMGDNTRQRSQVKEIFMSNAQQNSRPCARLHCGYTVEPATQFLVAPANAVIDAITDRLAISRGMNIHQCTDKKVVVSFPYHKEALRAMKLDGAREILHIDDCPYRFSMGDALVHTRSVTVCRQVYLTLRCLPLQMWAAPIVEQILSPYCALEYIDQATRSMDDLSVFTCIVRCQKAVPIPDEIHVKVPQDSSPQDLELQNSATSLFLNRYAVFLDKAQYIHGVTNRCKYKSEPTAASISHTVAPTECYISARMFDQSIIQKYSSAVILHPKGCSYFSDLRHVCIFVRENVHVRVRVKMLTDDAFLLCFAEDHPFMSLHKILSVLFHEWIVDGELELIQWTTQYGSIGDAVTELAELKITGLPCNFNSVPIIEYILSPFAFVKSHVTMTNDSTSDIGNTITSYRCSVWCVSIDSIPTMVQVKVLPLYLTDTTQISSDGKCRCPVLNVSIRASSILGRTLSI